MHGAVALVVLVPQRVTEEIMRHGKATVVDERGLAELDRRLPIAVGQRVAGEDVAPKRRERRRRNARHRARRIHADPKDALAHLTRESRYRWKNIVISSRAGDEARERPSGTRVEQLDDDLGSATERSNSSGDGDRCAFALRGVGGHARREWSV